MNLTHYTPNRFLGHFDELLNQTLRNFGHPVANRLSGIYRAEDQNSYRLRLDLPGFTREEISLSLEKHDLTVTAASDREEAFLQDVKRTFTLPDDIDPEGITAKVENGVLDLTLPKLNAEDKGVRTIEVS